MNATASRHIKLNTPAMESAKSILIIDDSASIRKLVSIALGGRGYELIESVDGAEGLDLVRSRSVDLIICDVNMPNLDGISFLQKIREIDAHRFTPVIMLTTESQEALKEQGHAAGARAWIVKPFQAEQLVAAVERLLV